MVIQNRQAPVLDRRATLSIAPRGTRSKGGKWTQGNPVDHEIWACLKDLELEQEPSGVGGWFQTGMVEVITRYRRDVIVEAVSGDVSQQTGHAFIGWALTLDGVQYDILDAEEMPVYGRRRFMKIRGERR